MPGHVRSGVCPGKWRNGRRARFRSVCPKGREGSTPSFPTYGPAWYTSGAFFMPGFSPGAFMPGWFLSGFRRDVRLRVRAVGLFTPRPTDRFRRSRRAGRRARSLVDNHWPKPSTVDIDGAPTVGRRAGVSGRVGARPSFRRPSGGATASTPIAGVTVYPQWTDVAELLRLRRVVRLYTQRFTKTSSLSRHAER
jgi:hypothetical protein